MKIYNIPLKSRKTLVISSFYSQTRDQLASLCGALGVPSVHALDLYREAYKGLNHQPWSRLGLPKVLKAYCQENFLETPKVRLSTGILSGYDGSVKFRAFLPSILETAQDSQKELVVETVLMPEKKRITLCVSTQVGCAQGCVFCHTGRMGLIRNLLAAEIVGQILAAKQWIRDHPEWLQQVGLKSDQTISNIVFMGMGEPLDNVDELITSIDIMTDPYGLALGLRHLSVSTAGHLDGLKILLSRVKGVRLALSVHSPDEVKRGKIMPIQKRWPLTDVVNYLEEELPSNGGSVMLQYTLIAGVNDSLQEAQDLVLIAKRLQAKVNIIPLNTVAVNRLKSPTQIQVQTFRDVLHKEGVRVMVRYSKGQDIAAACGQLVVES